MSSAINKILIIGATSGLGESFARAFHSRGKKVIVTGRRKERLSALERELAGVQGVQWDVAKLEEIQAVGSSILKQHPDLDTVLVVAGVQKSFIVADPSTSTTSSITSEIEVNFTAPVLLSRLFLPHLMSLASAGKPSNLMLVSSGLAFIPFGFYPVYCPTKAAIHSFCLTLRQQLNSAPDAVKKHLSVCEIVPPYVDTALDAEHRDAVNDMLHGQAPAPMGLQEYIDASMKQLDEVGNGKLPKEVAVDFAQMGVDAWRKSLGKALLDMGIDC